MDVPKMPEAYKGEYKKSCGYIDTQPRTWNSQEIAWLKSMINDGYNVQQIAESMDRSVVSISLKKKRLMKSARTYNAKHIEEKYALNQFFLDVINPETVLDLFCGEKSFYSDKGMDVTTNDINKSIEADFHEDAFKLLCSLYSCNRKFDLIDLDPFGSAYDCFDLAIKMANKGLCITLGELGHKRFKRVDYVRSRYGIETLEDFTMDNLITHIQQIGVRNKKRLTLYSGREWRNIGRVYFIIEPLKITEQWKQGD